MTSPFFLKNTFRIEHVLAQNYPLIDLENIRPHDDVYIRAFVLSHHRSPSADPVSGAPEVILRPLGLSPFEDKAFRQVAMPCVFSTAGGKVGV